VEKGPGRHAAAGVYELVGLLPSYGDPRIHAAVVCASVSCPDLSNQAYTSDNINALLDERCAAWLAHPEKGMHLLDPPTGSSPQLKLSPIFEWYRSDFDSFKRGDRTGLRGFLEEFAPADLSLSLRELPEEAFEEEALAYFEYNWSLNGAPEAAAAAAEVAGL